VEAVALQALELLRDGVRRLDAADERAAKDGRRLVHGQPAVEPLAEARGLAHAALRERRVLRAEREVAPLRLLAVEALGVADDEEHLGARRTGGEAAHRLLQAEHRW